MAKIKIAEERKEAFALEMVFLLHWTFRDVLKKARDQVDAKLAKKDLGAAEALDLLAKEVWKDLRPSDPKQRRYIQRMFARLDKIESQVRAEIDEALRKARG